MESDPVVGRTIERQTRTRQECTRSPVARDVVLSVQEATIGSDSRASTHSVLRQATNSFSLRICGCGAIESRIQLVVRCVDSARSGNRMKKVPPGEAAHFFSAPRAPKRNVPPRRAA